MSIETQYNVDVSAFENLVLTPLSNVSCLHPVRFYMKFKSEQYLAVYKRTFTFITTLKLTLADEPGDS